MKYHERPDRPQAVIWLADNPQCWWAERLRGYEGQKRLKNIFGMMQVAGVFSHKANFDSVPLFTMTREAVQVILDRTRNAKENSTLPMPLEKIKVGSFGDRLA